MRMLRTVGLVNSRASSNDNSCSVVRESVIDAAAEFIVLIVGQDRISAVCICQHLYSYLRSQP